MTLLVRDEADVVDSHLAFHLNAGVDYVVATDHRSQDGTTEILDRYARDGRLHLIREEDVEYRKWSGAPGWRRSSRPSLARIGSSTATPTSSGGRAGAT